MRRTALVTLFLILIFILTGCTQNAFNTNSQSSFDDDSLLLFKSKINEEVGQLYGIELDGGEYPVAMDAKRDGFFINQNNGEIIYRNEEDSFYSFLNEEKTKIASDVRPGAFYNTDNYKYFFSDNESDSFYALNEEYEKEKISSEIEYFEINDDGSLVAFIKDDNLYARKIADDDKIKISSDVGFFFMSGKGNVYVFPRLDRGYYLRDLRDDGEDAYKIASDEVFIFDLQVDDMEENIFFIKSDDSDKLGLCFLDENKEAETVASDVVSFWLDEKGIFVLYLNSDDNLYYYDIKTKESEKIATDIYNAVLNEYGNSILYMNNDDALYLYENGKDAVKLADDVVDYQIYGNNVFYYTKDDALYFKDGNKESEKLGDDIETYVVSSNGKDVAYVMDNEIFIKLKGQEPKVAITTATDYSKIYYSNQELFANTLRLSDLDGYWYYENDKSIIKISTNGKLVVYTNDSSLLGIEADVKIVNSEETYCELEIDYVDFDYTDNLNLDVIDKNTINLGGSPFIKIDDNKFEELVYKQEDITGEWYSSDFDMKVHYSCTIKDGKLNYSIYDYDSGNFVEYIFDYDVNNYGIDCASLNLKLVEYKFMEKNEEISQYKDYISSVELSYSTYDGQQPGYMNFTFNDDNYNRDYLRNTDGNLENIFRDFINYNMASDQINNYYYATSSDIEVYEYADDSATILGYLYEGEGYYIEDAFVDDNGDLWMESYEYDDYSWDYSYFWFKYPDVNISGNTI